MVHAVRLPELQGACRRMPRSRLQLSAHADPSNETGRSLQQRDSTIHEWWWGSVTSFTILVDLMSYQRKE